MIIDSSSQAVNHQHFWIFLADPNYSTLNIHIWWLETLAEGSHNKIPQFWLQLHTPSLPQLVHLRRVKLDE